MFSMKEEVYMSKNILFVMPHLYTGGITTAFLNLINSICNNTELNIDILLFNHDNTSVLPDNVNVIPTNKMLRLISTSQEKIRKESLFLSLMRLGFGAISKFIGSHIAYKIIFGFCPRLSKYDFAISYCQSSSNRSFYGGMNDFVIDKVDAKTKISFLHCDYSQCGSSDSHNDKVYEKFDKIAAVSQGVKDAFISVMPHLESKVHVVHNCHQVDRILSLSKVNTFVYDNDVLNIITVARISAEKGHYRALEVFARLKNEGYKFRWHIIGGADVRTEVEFAEKIENLDLKDCVVMHGNQNNPYRFFPNADVMLLPSYHEAAPMVFSEAEILGLPVITTDTLSAKEFVADKGIGIVCDSNVEGIYDSLSQILKNPHILSKFSSKYKTHDNYEQLEEFYALLK